MARSAAVLGHWHLLVDDFNTSALDFYTSIEQAVAARQVPGIGTSRVDWKEGGILSAKREYLRVGLRRMTFDICAAPYGTGYFFSWWFAEQPAQYGFLFLCLAIAAFPIVSVLCIATFGTLIGLFICFFVWLFAVGLAFVAIRDMQFGDTSGEDVILAMIGIGPIYRRLFRPVTYYSTDTHIMFQESIHRAVVESIEGIRTARGLRALSPEQVRPTMRDVLR